MTSTVPAAAVGPPGSGSGGCAARSVFPGTFGTAQRGAGTPDSVGPGAGFAGPGCAGAGRAVAAISAASTTSRIVRLTRAPSRRALGIPRSRRYWAPEADCAAVGELVAKTQEAVDGSGSSSVGDQEIRRERR